MKRLLQLVGITMLAIGLIALISPTLFYSLLTYLPEDIQMVIMVDQMAREMPVSLVFFCGGMATLWASRFIH